jgi:HSP20 family molecular chaperone IbpA
MPKTETREAIVNVKEGSPASPSGEPMPSEFVRQGLIAIQAVNRGLNRMQAELAYLVNSTGRTPSAFSPLSPYATQAAFAQTPFGLVPAPIAAFPQASPFAVGSPFGIGSPFASPIPTGAFGFPAAGFGTPQGTLTGIPQPSAIGPSATSPWAPNIGASPFGIQAGTPQQSPPSAGFATRIPISSPGTFQGSIPGQAGFPAGQAASFAQQASIPGQFSPFATNAPFATGIAPPGIAPIPSSQAPGQLASPAFAYASQIPLGWSEGITTEAGLAQPLFRSTQDLQAAAPINRVPNADLIDEGSEFLIRVEVPGCTPERLEVVCYPTGIVLSARSEGEIPDGTLLLSESGRVNFRRTIELPAEIRTNECRASLQDGILTVRLAKQVPTEGPRHVDVAYR